MKSQIGTIFKKECARFFGDKTLMFTAVIMPGLLIYIIYSLMGSAMKDMIVKPSDDVTTVYVQNMPRSLEPLFDSLPYGFVADDFDQQEVMERLSDKENNEVMLIFPFGFDSLTAAYKAESGLPAPNVQIFYNSTNNGSSETYMALNSLLTVYENSISNMFDINYSEDEDAQFDQASEADAMGDLLSGLIPMLILVLLYSGCMAVAPTAIAGEKERGTIATLLVTPMKRSHLALGKITSLSLFSLMSGISSFLGIILSLPKLLLMDESIELGNSLLYTTTDYIVLLLIILSTVLVMVSVISLLSALAKDVKSAGTMLTPFMLIIMLAGLLPMINQGADPSPAYYLVPFYNSVEVMSHVFDYSVQQLPVVITFCSNLAYTGLSVFALTKLFNSERAMFGR